MLLSLCFFEVMHAQDSIFLNDRSLIIGKVIRCTEHQLIYKRQDNLQGPNYVISGYAVDRIHYHNGNRVAQHYVAPWRRENTAKAKTEAKTDSSKINGNPSSNSIGFGNSKSQFSSIRINPKNSSTKPFDFYRSLYLQKDPFIQKECKKTKLFSGLSQVGFLAIPMGLSSYYHLMLATGMDEGDSKKDKYVGYSILGLLGTFATVGFSVRMNELKSSHQKKATDAYCALLNSSPATFEKFQGSDCLIRDYRGKHFMLGGKIYTKEEIESYLLSKPDPKISKLIRMAQHGKNLRWVGLVDIPLTAAGIYFMAKAVDAELHNGGVKEGENTSTDKKIAAAFFISGSACFTIGISSQAAVRKNTRRAIALYNNNCIN